MNTIDDIFENIILPIIRQDFPDIDSDENLQAILKKLLAPLPEENKSNEDNCLYWFATTILDSLCSKESDSEEDAFSDEKNKILENIAIKMLAPLVDKQDIETLYYLGHYYLDELNFEEENLGIICNYLTIAFKKSYQDNIINDLWNILKTLLNDIYVIYPDYADPEIINHIYNFIIQHDDLSDRQKTIKSLACWHYEIAPASKRDYSLAFELFSMISDEEDTYHIKSYLAKMYKLGHGCKQDLILARQFYESIFEKHENYKEDAVNFEYELAEMYLYGKGGDINLSKAEKLLENLSTEYEDSLFLLAYTRFCRLYIKQEKVKYKDHQHPKNQLEQLYYRGIKAAAPWLARIYLIDKQYQKSAYFAQEGLGLTGFFLAETQYVLAALILDKKMQGKEQQEQNAVFYLEQAALAEHHDAQKMLLLRYKQDIMKEKKADFINQVITLLLDKTAGEKDFPDHPPITYLRDLLSNLDEKFEGKSRSELREFLIQEQKKQGTYFSPYLSSDSDSEQENIIKNNTIPYMSQWQANALTHTKNANIDGVTKELQKILTGQYDNKDSKKLFSNIKPTYNSHFLNEPSVDKDLIDLNYFITVNNIDEALSSTTNKFVVAQFRCIAYNKCDWSREARKKHRKLTENDKPIFSSAVYHSAGLFSKEKLQERSDNELKRHAHKIFDQLLQLKKNKNFSKNNTQYKDELIYAQELYSNNYTGFHNYFSDKFQKNPFCSTGDLPFHALKYGYFLKQYHVEEEAILHPNWRDTGQAENPKTGKAYVLMFDLKDYLTEYNEIEMPHHLVSLNRQGLLQIKPQIIHEMETTFPAYIKPGQVKYTLNLKYPSFNKPYKQVYLQKYGLTQSLYDEFKAAIQQTKNDSKKRNLLETLLGTYLCAYHASRLYEHAVLLAKQHDSVLIFRSHVGGFMLNPPESAIPPGRSSDPMNKQEVNNMRRRHKKNKRSLAERDDEENIMSLYPQYN